MSSFRKLWRITRIAKRLEISHTTLMSAVGRGEIPYVTTGCGCRLVTISDVRKWMKTERKRGPKKKG